MMYTYNKMCFKDSLKYSYKNENSNNEILHDSS